MRLERFYSAERMAREHQERIAVSWSAEKCREATQWTAGKLNCQNCRARLGGFNFINRSQCPCGTDTSIHFSKSRLDYDHKHSILMGQPLRSRLNRGQMDISQNHEERAEFSTTTLDRFRDFNCCYNPQTSVGSPPSNSLSKKEKNHMKSVRRKQRRRERWLQHQKEKALAERVRVLLLDDNDDDDEEEEEEEEHQENRENLTCAVCLDVYFSPHRSQACGHVFCEPCLRAHAMNSGNDKTTCPLCRDVILYTNLQTELDQRAKTFFPKLYKARKCEFEASPCASWPLPEGIRDEDFPVLHFYGVQLGHILLKIFFVMSCILCCVLVLVFLCFILFFYCFRPYGLIASFLPD
ncbi:E3 ubiquitin-protein ligase RNF180-like [Pundamilia nyererei]|uniref:E3 ubiquitin-protein ligase RNF180-like n=1 Tax=Pundamilia nyererei TaxID=303518 RepID=A0A9Y3R2F7_9CICH|nr:PREDICTED: E3 ubiquitin-protein ligase RNF180-like [Pundamilia nyererei]